MDPEYYTTSSMQSSTVDRADSRNFGIHISSVRQEELRDLDGVLILAAQRKVSHHTRRVDPLEPPAFTFTFIWQSRVWHARRRHEVESFPRNVILLTSMSGFPHRNSRMVCKLPSWMYVWNRHGGVATTPHHATQLPPKIFTGTGFTSKLQTAVLAHHYTCA